jgi:hypothetical protein
VARLGAVNTSVHITAHQDPRPKIAGEMMVSLSLTFLFAFSFLCPGPLSN